MDKSILGIHHITAVASDPQRNLDFYGGVLGLRLVKLTVNFDDPSTYHFYFGDHLGRPGTILTFFPWPHAAKGHPGTGQVSGFSLSVPERALDFWARRLQAAGVEVERPGPRFEADVLSFADPDGLPIELVAEDGKPGDEWGDVPAEYAIRGFHGATLSEEGYERTANLLTETLGFRPISEDGSRHRFVIGAGGPGAIVDVLCLPDAPQGAFGAGTVHHIAWRTSSAPEQSAWQWKLGHLGLNVTPIVDRQYFQSIYFREPGG
ncbi:MAG TPA: VOC family protein, partial [Capsulimonadaceae bacterium]|nr:VOC family protein [Capsulimonadaceae bacterium]